VTRDTAVSMFANCRRPHTRALGARDPGCSSDPAVTQIVALAKARLVVCSPSLARKHIFCASNYAKQKVSVCVTPTSSVGTETIIGCVSSNYAV
jgi:hypothetical protein